MDWLALWRGTDAQTLDFHETFRTQLEREIASGHVLYGIPTRLIARGNGDDALFTLLDGSNRVALVHLTWSSGAQTPPWPATTLFASLEQWVAEVMEPEHPQWLDED